MRSSGSRWPATVKSAAVKSPSTGAGWARTPEDTARAAMLQTAASRRLMSWTSIQRQPGRPAIKGDIDMVGHRGLEGVVVQIDMQIGQEGAFDPRPRDPVQRPLDMGVGWMRRPAQGVHDPELAGPHRLDRRLVQIGHVAGIGHRAHTIADGPDRAVRLIEGHDRDIAAGATDSPRLSVRRDQPFVQNGRIPFLALENIWKTSRQRRL